MTTLTPFGQYLYRLRNRRSMHNITKDTDISPSTWSRLERGKIPDVVTIMSLHKHFNLAYDFIFHLLEEGLKLQGHQPGSILPMQTHDEIMAMEIEV